MSPLSELSISTLSLDLCLVLSFLAFLNFNMNAISRDPSGIWKFVAKQAKQQADTYDGVYLCCLHNNLHSCIQKVFLCSERPCRFVEHKDHGCDCKSEIPVVITVNVIGLQFTNSKNYE